MNTLHAEMFRRGLEPCETQGRIREIADPAERVRAIAKDFAENPTNTLVVSPDNASRRELNNAIRTELQSKGIVAGENHMLKVLVQQQDLTGADRRWAARYAVNDQLRYSRGSNAIGIERGSYARVVSTNLQENLLTVETKTGDLVTYDPRRLTGVSIYRETEQPFAVGDRLQFTAPDKSIGVANRELGTIENISAEGNLTDPIGERQDRRSESFRESAFRSWLCRHQPQRPRPHGRSGSDQC